MTANEDREPACACNCHASAGAFKAACSIDTGSSGVEGVPSCSPCSHAVADEDACVLAHPENVKRYTGNLCKRHYHWIGQTLTQITELYALLGYVVIPGRSGSGGNRPTKGVEAPTPIRLEIVALRDRRNPAPGNVPMTYARNWNGRDLESNGDDLPDVPGSLFALVERVHDGLPTNPERKLPDGTLVTSARWLRGWTHWLACQEWIGEYTDELATLHRALAGATGAGMWPASIGKCPNCQAKLYNTVGLDAVTCRKCGSEWTGIHLVRLRLLLEQESA